MNSFGKRLANDVERQKLIQDYHYVNVEEDWWDCAYDDIAMSMKSIGVPNGWGRTMSGFDLALPPTRGGVSMEYRIYTQTIDWDSTLTCPKLAHVRDMLRDIHNLIILSGMGGLAMRVEYARGGSRNSTHVDTWYAHTSGDRLRMEYGVYDYYSAESEFDDLVEVLTPKIDVVCDAVSEWAHDVLAAEYDHLTSDEAIWDTIVASELNVIHV